MRIGVQHLLFLAAYLAACGGENGTGPGGGPATPFLSPAVPSGDGQLGAPSRGLIDPLRVRVSQGAVPLVGQPVTWTVVTGGGSLVVNNATTDQTGLSSAVWTLGPNEGPHTVTASAPGVRGSPVTFGATAIVPPLAVTVNVLNNTFQPDNVLLALGGTVTFNWAADSRQHSIIPIVGNTPSVPLPLRDGPRMDDFVFQVGGKYEFYCSNHGSPVGGMNGKITVQ